MRPPLPCLLLAAGSLLGETVGTASRTLNLNPEEIVVQLLIETPTGTTLEQSVGALGPLGMTQQNLESVGTLRDAPDRLGWQYSFIRPFPSLYDLLKQIDYTRRQLRETGIPLTYQFFLRPTPKTVDAAKRRVLSELIEEARRSASASGKLRSVSIEPTPSAIDHGRDKLLFGQSSGLLQYNLSVVAIFE